MDQVILAQKLESLRRCIRRVEEKTPGGVDQLVQDPDIQDILVLNLTRAVQLCVDIGSHVISETDEPAPTTMGVSMKDGIKSETSILCLANSIAKLSVKLRTANLEAEYTALMDKLGFEQKDIIQLIENAIGSAWCNDSIKTQLRNELNAVA